MPGKYYNKDLRRNLFKLVLQELKEDPYYKFKLVFALMGVIPLLTFAYILLGVLPRAIFSFSNISVILYILIAISLLAFFLGYETIKKLLNRIIFYAAEAKRTEQLKADLAASVSHDFEIPIRVLKESISNISNGSHGPLTDTQKQRLSSCQETLDNMLSTIKTLLDLYKIEAGLVCLKKEPCDLSKLIDEKVSEFSFSFEKRGIKIGKNFPEKMAPVSIDKDKIKEVVNNIFSNFLKYTPQGGWVDIRLSASRDFARLEFINNSEAIPLDKLGFIFDKFKRLYDNKEGSGLGLAISKDIVEIHGGNLWAENIPDKGVVFVIVLPCA